MTRVEFHVVESGAHNARLQYATDWLGALGTHVRAHVLIDNDLPPADRATLVAACTHISLLAAADPPPRPDKNTVLINLATQVPPFFSRYRCALDIADKRGATVECDRARYRFYRDRGYPITLHTIDAQEVA